jgi:hypothetical protein
MVAAGFVPSLARPGGNITGVSILRLPAIYQWVESAEAGGLVADDPAPVRALRPSPATKHAQSYQSRANHQRTASAFEIGSAHTGRSLIVAPQDRLAGSNLGPNLSKTQRTTLVSADLPTRRVLSLPEAYQKRAS